MMLRSVAMRTALAPAPLRTLVLLALCAASALVAGCGPREEKLAIHGSPRSSGMDGQVTVTPQPEFGNSKVRVDLTFVTPPDRIAPGARTYVVWDRRGDRLTRLGQLQFDGESREAKFEATTLPGGFELMVTAEPNANVPLPSPQTLLIQRVVGNAR